MIIADTGPLVSAITRAEGRRHRFAAELLSVISRDLMVPWPVFTELDLLLSARRHPHAAVVFAKSLLDGVHRLEAPSDDELALTIDLASRYESSGADLPDLTVMATAARRSASILTWDFRHFRSVVLRRGHHWDLIVRESELPEP